LKRSVAEVTSLVRQVILGFLCLAACGGGDADAPDAAVDVTCDPVAQDCRDGDKCTYTDPEGDGLERECVAPTGTVGVDQPCVRDASGFGHDDCAAGGFCTFIGVLPPEAGGMRYCRATCGSDDDCGDGQRCAAQLEDPPEGFCGPTCAPFSTCDDGMTCAELYAGVGGDFDLFLVCRVVGVVPGGGACTANTDCGADHVCLTGFPGIPEVCRALCDDAHPCAGAGEQCYEPGGGIGMCVEM